MPKVYIGVGHGGSDSGAVAKNGIKEKDANLVTARACYDYLKSRGLYAKMSRVDDSEIWLPQRIEGANAYGADLALDIHYNAGGGDGAEVYHSYTMGKGKTLANNILKEFEKIGQNSRGTKIRKNDSGHDYFGFIRQTKMPAVLVECGFLDNYTDLKLFDTKAEQKRMGVAIAKGVLKTLGIADKEVNKPKPNKKPQPKPQPKPQNPVEDINKEAIDNMNNVINTIIQASYKSFISAYLQDGYTFPDLYNYKGDWKNKNITKYVQSMLGFKKEDIDGKFGDTTEQAVKKFQKEHNLKADGYIGYNTWKALLNIKIK